MAGSYQHCVDKAGRLLDPESLSQMLENGGDVYEAVEEMYGMIWYLANGNGHLVRQAEANYTNGFTWSPDGAARDAK